MIVSHDDPSSATRKRRSVRNTAPVKRPRLRMACGVSVQRSNEERVADTVRDIRPRNSGRAADLEPDITGWRRLAHVTTR